ncbi:hypothetical protein RN001_011403 [Aquatica leii]|uniref:Peptidase S1 domain-containing protein n=1 Tax=Aquatica leii TaxID=1421715 RepID=A0AAN7SEZ6_9COLE|nr:hypothetical protein RN001_011403 [Aquatica leii]
MAYGAEIDRLQGLYEEVQSDEEIVGGDSKPEEDILEESEHDSKSEQSDSDQNDDSYDDVSLSKRLENYVGKSGSSTASVAPRISNGAVAITTKYLYQAAFQVGTTLLCGGTVLNTRWILSAAHCFDGANLANVVVRVGTSGLLIGGTTYTIATVTVHNLYDINTRIYDVALVKTTTAIIYGTTILPVVLGATSAINGAVGVVTGWGQTTTNPTPPSLNVMNTTVITNSECITALVNSPTTTVTTTHMCAKSLVSGACTGDDGGPLILSNMEIGILSFPQCTPGTPDVYTKIAPVYTWILTNIPEA